MLKFPHMRVEPSIFKAYDIRGIYPKDLDASTAYALGRAFSTLLLKRQGTKKLKIAVGADMRLSSPELKENFMNGVADSGIDVDDIGCVSTPTFYFCVAYFGYDGGAQVSASHNPKEWNGFKLVGKRSSPIGKDDGIGEMEKMIGRDDFVDLAGEAKGIMGQRADVVAREITVQRGIPQLSGDKSIKPFKIAIDAGNGMGSEDMKALFQTLPCSVVWMNSTPDGNFPAHPPDPMDEKNNRDLQKKIVAEKCDVGIAIDGDADRYFFFDEKGQLVPQEIMRGLMAQIEIRDNPGATVVYDIRPGKITTDLIDEAGGRAIRAPVGHSLIKKAMLVEDAVFGAESSGHYFYKLPYGTFEAPIVLLMKFLTFLTKEDKLLSEIVAPHKKYSNSGEINTRLNTREEGIAALARVQAAYVDGTQNTVDGLSVEYPDFWFNVRLSNTEPLIRLIVEALDKGVMEKKRGEIVAVIRNMLK